MGISITITEKCNLKCKYCYETNCKNNNTISYENIDKSLEFLKEELKVRKKISIHGGEPFLEIDKLKYSIKKIRDIESEINEKIIITTTSNATILNEDILSIVSKDIDGLTISIDGNEEAHDKFRVFKNGEGSHNKVLKNAKIFNDIVDNLRIRMTFNKDTTSLLYESFSFLVENGFKTIVAHPDMNDKNWDEEDLEVLFKNVLKIKDSYSERDINSNLLEKDLTLLGNCEIGMNIYHDGTIYPCIGVIGNEEMIIGNVNEGIYKEKIDRIIHENKKVISSCRNCDLYDYCEGTRCKIINKTVTGSFELPSPIVCRFNGILFQTNEISLKNKNF